MDFTSHLLHEDEVVSMKILAIAELESQLSIRFTSDILLGDETENTKMLAIGKNIPSNY